MNHRFIFLLLYLFLFHEITIEARKGKRTKSKLTKKEVCEEDNEADQPKEKTTKKKTPEKTDKPEKPKRKRLPLFKPKILVRRKPKPPEDPCDDRCECREPKQIKACTTSAESQKDLCICPSPLTPFQTSCPSFPGAAGVLPCICDEDGENVIMGMFGRVFNNFATKIRKYEQEYQLRKQSKLEKQRNELKKKIQDKFRNQCSKGLTFSGRKCKRRICKNKEKKPSLFAMKAPKRLGRKEQTCRKSFIGREERISGMMSREERGKKLFQARTMRTKGSR